MNDVRHVVEYVTSPPEWGAPLRIWDVHRLWRLAYDVPVREIPIAEISDLDRVGWFGEASNCGRLTVREVTAHARRIAAADLTHPVLLSSQGFLFDGLHRLAKASMEGRTHILAKRFRTDPAPDRQGALPEWLASLGLDRPEASQIPKKEG